MKKLLITLFLLVGCALAGYGLLVKQNNASAPEPDRARLQSAFGASVLWLRAHEQEILESNNPMLWWMIQRSADLSGNSDLVELFDEYRKKRLQSLQNIWLPLFDPGRWVPVRIDDLAAHPDYNLLFIYGISCDKDLGQLSKVRAQLHPDFCDESRLSPACATHQLIGLRLVQRGRCEDPDLTAAAIASLQSRIENQLVWDPRVVDVYLQRVLTLLESGARDLIKPIWLQRVLDAQLADGGWSAFEPLLMLPATDQSLGFGPRGITISTPTSNFHATAQGVLILSFLLNT